MLNNADFSQFKHVYIFVGKTDLRKGIDGLATLVKQKFSLDPFQPGNLFLFCGSSNRKMKGLVWEEKMDSCWFINVWRQEFFNGLETQKKPGALRRNSTAC